MIVVNDISSIRAVVRDRRTEGGELAFVPTMGNLHAGHLRLVETVRTRVCTVVASIYVNPLQFGENEDFNDYPRTLEEDLAALRAHGVDIVFVPDDSTMYPCGPDLQTKVEVPRLTVILCGQHRPGHFVGVATVVNRLFNIVQPDLAVFGKKDYQQLTIIRRMVTDLAMPIRVLGVDTVREADGLALSSRNRYLSTEQRAVAPGLYGTLCSVRDSIKHCRADLPGSERDGFEKLKRLGFVPDYVSVRRQGDLDVPAQQDRRLVALAAARLGNARLIDNIEFESP